MTRTIKVKGMSCQHCVNAVSKTLSGIEGVQGVKIDQFHRQRIEVLSIHHSPVRGRWRGNALSVLGNPSATS